MSMKIRANEIDLKDAERFGSFPSTIFNCKIKHCRFKKAEQYNEHCSVENGAKKDAETFCIFKINIVGSNFHAQTVLFPNLQFA